MKDVDTRRERGEAVKEEDGRWRLAFSSFWIAFWGIWGGIISSWVGRLMRWCLRGDGGEEHGAEGGRRYKDGVFGL